MHYLCCSPTLSHFILILRLNFKDCISGRGKGLHYRILYFRFKSWIRFRISLLFTILEQIYTFSLMEEQPWLLLVLFEDYGSCLRAQAGLGVITVLRDAWLNGNITVRDAHRAALNYECPGPLKSSEPAKFLIAVVYWSGGRCSSAWVNHEFCGYCAISATW